MPSYAVTGASRGLGLAFVEHVAQSPSNVIYALVRNPDSSPKLTALAESNPNIHILKADITSPTELAEAASFVAKTTGKLDVLIENAALIFGDVAAYGPLDFAGHPEETTAFEQALTLSMTANVVSVVHTTNAFIDLIRKGDLKKIVVLSTGIADVPAILRYEVAGNIPYAASKAAVNVVVAKYATQLKKDGITIVAMSPGLVQTGANEETANLLESFAQLFKKHHPEYAGILSPSESVSKIFKVVDGLTVADGGRFLSQNGNQEWL
ncbi:C-factor [Dactylellina cionopaga]|nr:C-factor [Dactylellina cionopaga]